MKFKVGDEVMHVRNIDLCGIVDGGGSNKHWEVKLHSGEHRTFHEADLTALPTPISSKMKFEVGDMVTVEHEGVGRITENPSPDEFIVSMNDGRKLIEDIGALEHFPKRMKEDNRMKDELIDQLERMKESLAFTTDEVSAFTLEHFQGDRQHEIALNITIEKENK